MRFKNRPRLVEAVKYQAELGNDRIFNWLAQQGANVGGWTMFDGEINIPTRQGTMTFLTVTGS